MKPTIQTDRYTLYCADCLDVLPTLEAGSVDLTITSPPYDDLRDYGKDFDAKEFNWHGIIEQLYRVTADGGVVVWIVADATINGSETGTSFRQALYAMECGFRLHDTMIWNKRLFTSPQSVRYPNSFEYMFVFSKGDTTCNQIRDRKNNKAGSKTGSGIRKANGVVKPMYKNGQVKVLSEIGVRFNVWPIFPEQSNRLRKHPAQFPESLARDHIISWSNPGDVVLDPMMGSGTTGKMAAKLDRKFIGVELDSDYFDIAHARIANAYDDYTLTPAEKASPQMSLLEALA